MNNTVTVTPATVGCLTAIIDNLNKRVAALEARLDLFPEHRVVMTAQAHAIIRTVSNHFGLRNGDIYTSARPDRIALPRQVAMYIITRHLPDFSTYEIGALFRGKTHGSVSHAYHTVTDRMSVDPHLRAQVEHLLAVTKPAELSTVLAPAVSTSTTN